MSEHGGENCNVVQPMPRESAAGAQNMDRCEPWSLSYMCEGSRCWADDMGGRACYLESRRPSVLVTGRGVARQYSLVVSLNGEIWSRKERGGQHSTAREIRTTAR